MQLANYAVLQNYGIDTNNIYKKNTNRPVIYGITIDNNVGSFLDDGITLSKKNGKYILQISITDVSECIPLNSKLDLVARKKQIDNDKNFLFPIKVKKECLSLNQSQVNLAFTFEIILNSNLDTINIRFFKSAFVNQKSYTHNSFDQEIEKGKKTENSMAIKIKSFTEKLYYKVNGEMRILNADKLVECLMVYTNKQVATYCNKNDIPVIYHNKSSSCENKYTLDKTGYTTFTSPMRKYTDIITHIQIKNYLENKRDYSFNNTKLQKIVNQLNELNCLQNNNNFSRKLVQNIISNEEIIDFSIYQKLIPILEKEIVDPFVIFYIIYYINTDEKIKNLLLSYFSKQINKIWGRALFAFIKYNTNLKIELHINCKRNGKRFKDKKSVNRNSTIYLNIDGKVFEFTKKRKRNEQLSSKAMEMLFSKLYKYIHDNKINIFENI